MNILEIIKVWIDDKAVYIKTKNGEEYHELFADYPRLKFASKKQLEDFEYDNVGIHWQELDEDLSYEGFIKHK